ncbi:MAG: hemin uptake protein HemP [Comamonas sp.]|jgi:hemin uptake protein HemP
MSTSHQPASPAHTANSNADAQSAPTPAGLVESQDLLRGNKAVSIVHNGAVYRLQSTKLGKLILTK